MPDSPDTPAGREGVPPTRQHLRVASSDRVEEHVGDVAPDDRDDGIIVCW